MIHYTCDRCKRQIDPDEQTRYIVQIDIQSSTDEPGSTIDDDIDQLTVLHQTLDDIHAHTLGDEGCDCGHHGRYDLCQECYGQLLKNPLGRDAMLALGFSNN